MLYLDDEKLAWAKASGDHENDSSVDLHKDAYGALMIANTKVPDCNIEMQMTAKTSK